MRERCGPVGIEVGQGLQGKLHADITRDVEERSTGPERSVERGELRAVRRNERVEVPLDELGVRLGRPVQIAEHDAESVQILPRGRPHNARQVRLEGQLEVR